MVSVYEYANVTAALIAGNVCSVSLFFSVVTAVKPVAGRSYLRTAGLCKYLTGDLVAGRVR